MTAILLAMALAEPAEVPVPQPAAYVQTLSDGTVIDWLAGVLVVTGRSRIVYDIEASDVKARMTKLKAEGDGREKLMHVMSGLYLDGTATFGDDPERVRTARLKLQSVKSVSQSKKQPGWLAATMVVPLWGEQSVLGWFVEAGEKADAEATAEKSAAMSPLAAASAASGDPAPGDENGREVPTGLVVDATHLTGNAAVVPALLPRIVDEKGHVLYGVDTAGPAAARAAGLVGYAIVPPPGSAVVSESPVIPSREGASPLSVKAVAAGGPARTDIVVSEADGDRIRQQGLHGAFPAEGRVVVLMPTPPRPKFDVVVPRKPGARNDPTSPGNIP